MEHASFKGGSTEIVSGSDGMQISGKVQVQLRHGHDLTVAATSSAAFDAEGWTLAGLAHAGDRLVVHVRAQRLNKPHSGGAFTLTKRRGINAGNQHIFAVGSVRQALANAEFDFGLVGAVVVELVLLYAVPVRTLEGQKNNERENGAILGSN